MSKEQTPITAKEMYATKECRMMEMFEFAEFYSNVKVLEALERLIIRIDEINDDNDKTGNILTSFGVIKLIETEVKPKYE